MGKLKSFAPLIIILLISAVCVLIWFRDGVVFGGAEVGLLTYNPGRWLEIQKYLWWEAVAPGWPIPHFLNAIPLYFILAILKPILQSPVILQAMLFFVLLFMMGYGTYLFVLSILGNDKKIYATLAGLFYMFNPYTMVDIWHRFVYTGFFLAAFLPFLALFWKKWISQGRFSNLYLFLLVNFLASYMFGSISTIITVWLLLAVLTIPFIIFPWKGIPNFLAISKRFLFGFVLWILINVWWLYPLATNTPLLSESHSAEVNLTTLVNISRKTILPYTLQLTNPYYLFITAELGEAYKFFPITLVPWIATIIIGVGVFAGLRNRYTAAYAISYIIGVFFSKGVAIPFSAPLFFTFTNFYFLGVLRNTYEKIGILLPFFGSILFCLGIAKIKSWGVKKIGNVSTNFILFVILLIFFGYSVPLFTGKIFGNKQYPLSVEVPRYYKEADKWLLQYKEQEGNILHLPFSGRDVVTYNWDTGYHGVEINELLFTSHPSISRKVGQKDTDKLLESLTYLFAPPYSSDKEQILKLLQNLSVKFIVLHKDTNWLDIDTYGVNIKLNNPQEMAVVLDGLPFLEKAATFGKLDIYKISESNFKSRVFLSNNVQLVYPGNVSALHLLKYTKNKGDTISPANNNLSIPDLGFRQVLIFPQNSISFKKLSDGTLENLLKANVLDPKGTNSILTKLNNMKNYFDQSGELESRDRAESLTLATDSLIKENDTSLLDEYRDLMYKVFKGDFKTSSFVKLFRSTLGEVFILHLYVLDKKENDLAVKTKEELKKNLIINGFLPRYQFNTPEEINKKLFQFNTPLNTEYELVMDDFVGLEDYSNLISNIDTRINANQTHFGNISLDKGEYELSLNELISSNLVPKISEWTRGDNVTISENTVQLISLAEESFIETPISGIGGEDKLRITFEGFLENGNIFYVLISSDTEYQEDGNQQLSLFQKCIVHVCYPIYQSPNISGWQSLDFTTQYLNPSTQKASLKILLPFGSKLNIRNIQVQKVLDNTLFLKKEFPNLDISNLDGEIKNMNKNSPVLYSGKISLKKPLFMFFNQTFHPKWSLRLRNKDANFFVDKHYIGNYFANAWYIEEPGDYDFEIKFDPQENVNKGFLISVITFAGFSIVLVFMKLRQL